MEETTQSSAPSSAPQMNVAAEIAAIQANKVYTDGKRGNLEHDRLVDRMLELQGIAAGEEEEQQSGGAGRTDASDHIGARDNLAPDPTQARPSALDAVLPDAMTVDAKRAWVATASEIGMGSRELAEVAKLALEFCNDNSTYTFEQGDAVLREQYGAKAPEMLRQAKEYLKAYPGLQQWIGAHGLGNNPHAIKVLADRQAGREAIEREIEQLRREPEFTAKVPRSHDRARQISERIMALQASLYE